MKGVNGGRRNEEEMKGRREDWEYISRGRKREHAYSVVQSPSGRGRGGGLRAPRGVGQ